MEYLFSAHVLRVLLRLFGHAIFAERGRFDPSWSTFYEIEKNRTEMWFALHFVRRVCGQLIFGVLFKEHRETIRIFLLLLSKIVVRSYSKRTSRHWEEGGRENEILDKTLLRIVKPLQMCEKGRGDSNITNFSQTKRKFYCRMRIAPWFLIKTKLMIEKRFLGSHEKLNLKTYSLIKISDWPLANSSVHDIDFM